MDFPLPEVTDLSKPYWEALQEGRLLFQRCRCGHAQLPPRRECTRCLDDTLAWEAASGDGAVVSFVIYHTAHHEAFRDRIPYNVAIVALAEGPRLITNITAPVADLRCDMKVRLAVEREGGFALARFAPA
jgi:uncharacterized OB-fold protein